MPSYALAKFLQCIPVTCGGPLLHFTQRQSSLHSCQPSPTTNEEYKIDIVCTEVGRTDSPPTGECSGTTALRLTSIDSQHHVAAFILYSGSSVGVPVSLWDDVSNVTQLCSIAKTKRYSKLVSTSTSTHIQPRIPPFCLRVLLPTHNPLLQTIYLGANSLIADTYSCGSF